MVSKLVSNLEIASIIPFGIPILGASPQTLTVKTDSELINVDLHVRKKTWGYTDEGAMSFVLPGVDFNNVIMTFDRFGQLNYTNVRLRFKIEPEKPYQEIQKSVNYYLDECLVAINKILDACRMVSVLYCPRNLIAVDIVGFYINCYSLDGENLQWGTIIGRDRDDVTSFFTITEGERNKIADLKDILISNFNIPLDEELIINATDHFLFRNYRIACVEIQSAVEHIISLLVRKHLTGLQESQEEIEKILSRRLDDLKPYLNQISTQITGGLEWQKWREKCYQVRNDVVHKGLKPDKSQTQEALSTGKQFIRFLKSFL